MQLACLCGGIIEGLLILLGCGIVSFGTGIYNRHRCSCGKRCDHTEEQNDQS